MSGFIRALAKSSAGKLGPMFQRFGLSALTWMEVMNIPLMIVNQVLGAASAWELMKMGKQFHKKDMQTAKSEVTFKDVIGIDDVKLELQEIVHFLVNSQKYQAIGARMPKGLLLCGPPGTGKTLLARAVAGEAKVPFYALSGSEFVEVWAGLGASRARDAFAKAKKSSPCVMFIDELDSVGRARSSHNNSVNMEEEQTLNQILTEMDGFAVNSGVVVLAATNRPDILDPALRRPGRFDREVHVTLPNTVGRQAMLDFYLTKIKKHPSLDTRLAADGTEGFSGAEIANVVNEAALMAVRNQHTEVHTSDLLQAVLRAKAMHQRQQSGQDPYYGARDKDTEFMQMMHDAASLKEKSSPHPSSLKEKSSPSSGTLTFDGVAVSTLDEAYRKIVHSSAAAAHSPSIQTFNPVLYNQQQLTPMLMSQLLQRLHTQSKSDTVNPTATINVASKETK